MDLAKEKNIKYKETADQPIVSFCIATFRRYEILKELIEEILSVRSDKIEVVVCDNNSQDGSIEKIRKIKDSRLRIYVNEINLGSSLNIYESLDKGNGEYLFYTNDRDNVDSFKVEKLVEILEALKKDDVAFAKCHVTGGNTEKYHVFDAGKDALLQFSCRIDHPTGYIFRKKIWKKINNRRKLFENQSYGDYPITQICAIMAKRYKGALIYGDICDLQRSRINFSREKSRYYEGRKDKRLWYTPEVIFREIKTGQKFLKKIGVEEEIRKQILVNRYSEYLGWCVSGYKDKIKDPVCTVHYNYYPRQDFFHVFTASILNGIKLWNKMLFWCMTENRKSVSQINNILQAEYLQYFRYILGSRLHVKMTAVKLKQKDDEITKREAVLNIYENWVDALISGKGISEYLVKSGYCQVAIYGMGRIGRHLYKEFRDSDVCVNFVIDQKLSRQARYYGDVPCLDSGMDFPYTELIIVTVASEANQIIDELRKKVTVPIRTIDDILFVLE